LNLEGFYDPLLEMLDRCVRERFMDERHARMWTAVRAPEELLPALRATPPWDSDPRRFAVPWSPSARSSNAVTERRWGRLVVEPSPPVFAARAATAVRPPLR